MGFKLLDVIFKMLFGYLEMFHQTTIGSHFLV